MNKIHAVIAHREAFRPSTHVMLSVEEPRCFHSSDVKHRPSAIHSVDACVTVTAGKRQGTGASATPDIKYSIRVDANGVEMGKQPCAYLIEHP